MRLRDFADQVLLSPELDRKLVPPRAILVDDDPGPPERLEWPVRPDRLKICKPKQAPPMPHPDTFGDPRRRAIAHHIMANHELQALEVMAFVLRAFPEAPTEFRQGLVKVMADEQKHTRWHADRCAELGVAFGDLRVNGYFWQKAQQFTCVLDYLAGLPLTFEGRNLDHTLEFEAWFEAAGDAKGAGILRAIHRDEIHHVAFGLHWLRLLKPEGQSDWETYAKHLHWPLRPGKSRGKSFHHEPRLAAGMTPEFIAQLEAAE